MAFATAAPTAAGVVASGAGSTDAWGQGANQLSSQTITNTRAFIQFAGFTAGRMRSFFDMYFQGNYALSQQRMNGDSTPNGIGGIAYTWQFGGGLSASFLGNRPDAGTLNSVRRSRIWSRTSRRNR